MHVRVISPKSKDAREASQASKHGPAIVRSWHFFSSKLRYSRSNKEILGQRVRCWQLEVSFQDTDVAREEGMLVDQEL